MKDRVGTMGGTMDRRGFLKGAGAAGLATLCGCRQTLTPGSPARGRLFFTSAGKTCFIHADGSGMRILELNAPNQVTWQPIAFFPDGRRVLFMSMEARRDGPGRPFDEFYWRTPAHIWIYDLTTGSLVETAGQDRLAAFYSPALLLGGDRMLVQVLRTREGQMFNMRVDGSDAREFTQAGEGLPYGFSASPDARRIAFHLASPQGYQIWTSDTEGRNRTLIAAHPDHLYFGPNWSPDGQWLAFEDCDFRKDPGHDWADVCVAKADGSGLKTVVPGQAMWFAATYGNRQKKGGGSNVVTWTRGGEVLFLRKLPGTNPAWEYQAQRPDVDHFNRDWKPETASGGTEICRVNPLDGRVTQLTRSHPPVWDFRAAESPDGRRIAFCRCATGELPALWTMNADGTGQRLLTRGIDDSGAEHPRWLPELG